MYNNYSHLFRLSYSLIALLLLVTLKPIGHTEEGRLYDFKPLPDLAYEKPSSCFSSNENADSIACLLEQAEQKQTVQQLSSFSGGKNETPN